MGYSCCPFRCRICSYVNPKTTAETIEESYDKEYGKDTVQIHKDAYRTGMMSYYCMTTSWLQVEPWKHAQIGEKDESSKIYVNFIIELKDLHGERLIHKDVNVESSIDFGR